IIRHASSSSATCKPNSSSHSRTRTVSRRPSRTFGTQSRHCATSLASTASKDHSKHDSNSSASSTDLPPTSDPPSSAA
ncbi:hypothetical protein AAVH_32132, partial [Aphelenchoides avenae]